MSDDMPTADEIRETVHRGAALLTCGLVLLAVLGVAALVGADPAECATALGATWLGMAAYDYARLWWRTR